MLPHFARVDHNQNTLEAKAIDPYHARFGLASFLLALVGRCARLRGCKIQLDLEKRVQKHIWVIKGLCTRDAF